MTATELQAPGGPAAPIGQAAPVSSNGGPPEDDQSLWDLVADALDESDNPNSGDVVAALVTTLDPDLLVKAAVLGLKQLARDISRRRRHRPGSSGGSSARWDAVAEAEREHKDVFMHRLCIVQGNQNVPPVFKFLGDCTKADLAAAEALIKERVAGELATIKALQDLRKQLTGDKQRVKSLNRMTVREVWNA